MVCFGTMKSIGILAALTGLMSSVAASPLPFTFSAPVAPEVQPLYDLALRQMPAIAHNFRFQLVDVLSNGTVSNVTFSNGTVVGGFNSSSTNGSFVNGSAVTYDSYEVTQDPLSKAITVLGTTTSALSTGLYRYLHDIGNVSISWTASTLSDLKTVPPLCVGTTCTKLTGAAVVPYRYHFNTVTFGYTTAFYSWNDWQHLLDWAALHGINLPLAWVGYEQVLVDVFRQFNFTDSDIGSFLSGPAFQPWNRFGNIQGSWNGTVSFDFFEEQLDLNKQIVGRMIDLGMTPILPSFTGFVPRSISELYPNAQVINSSAWEAFPLENTNDTFLEPSDPLFTQLQTAFLEQQATYYGNVTHFYTLDQYNENNPFSGNVTYLESVSSGTIASLKAFDPEAVWVMQGWLFFSSATFWTNDRIEAYLSGPDQGQLLILDLFSEVSPIWQQTNSYFGHNWIWCELHGYGGNMGLEGNVQVITQNFTEARANSSSLVGMGLTMEGQEGNQIVYDLALDQAWSDSAINITEYVANYIAARYGPGPVDSAVVDLWQQLIKLVYENDVSDGVQAVPKSVFELTPAVNGIANVTGHHPTKLFYSTSDFEALWKQFSVVALNNSDLLAQPHFHYDMVDFTRQLLANQFLDQYVSFNSSYKTANSTGVQALGQPLLDTLDLIDEVLYTDNNFLLSNWIASARALAPLDNGQADFFEFNARNQITLWGPSGQINNYASKQWAGLVGTYYKPLWQMFINELGTLNGTAFNSTKFDADILGFEQSWSNQNWGTSAGQIWTTQGDLSSSLGKVLVQA